MCAAALFVREATLCRQAGAHRVEAGGVAALKVVIVGGGTAGWMCAAALARLLDPSRYSVRLVESDEIGTVGVGEATLPQIKAFNGVLGVDEAEFMRETGATFKLGIEFVGWGRGEDAPYIHPFGAFGERWGGVDFHQLWTRARLAGGKTEPIQSYSYAVEACRRARFRFPDKDPKSIGSTFSYAYHLDAGLYAQFLRRWATQRKVVRTEGRVVDVELDPTSGAITAVKLKSGERLEGDLFVDASGFRSLLLGAVMKAPWEDWSAWLPCDRALAAPTGHAEAGEAPDLTPYTRSTAQAGGWIWRIPLQHRVGNGYVYASSFISDEAAHETLTRAIGPGLLADPRGLRFSAGRRLGAWTRNCVGVGLSSGFLEPLESTSIYLIQRAIECLVDLAPSAPGPVDQRLASEFNRLMDLEYERVRDFLILHYHLNGRQGEALWDYTRHMSIPDSLAARIELFGARGYVPYYRDGLFSKDSWLSVFFGQGLSPRAADPLAYAIGQGDLEARMGDLRGRIAAQVEAMPPHQSFISGFCPAPAAAPALTSGAA
jgi:tryptophan halogenase